MAPLPIEKDSPETMVIQYQLYLAFLLYLSIYLAYIFIKKG